MVTYNLSMSFNILVGKRNSKHYFNLSRLWTKRELRIKVYQTFLQMNKGQFVYRVLLCRMPTQGIYVMDYLQYACCNKDLEF